MISLENNIFLKLVYKFSGETNKKTKQSEEMDKPNVTDLILRELAILKTNSQLQYKILQQLSDPPDLIIKGIPIQSNEDCLKIESQLEDESFRKKLVSAIFINLGPPKKNSCLLRH